VVIIPQNYYASIGIQYLEAVASSFTIDPSAGKLILTGVKAAPISGC
jgi:hypothetical protein